MRVDQFNIPADWKGPARGLSFSILRGVEQGAHTLEKSRVPEVKLTGLDQQTFPGRRGQPGKPGFEICSERPALVRNFDSAGAVTRRTYDPVAQPFTGWGLVLHRDDILRIGHWLATGQGVIAGRQMLDPHMLAAALQRVPEDRGLQWLDPTFRYQNGFYGNDVSGDIGCAEPVWIPYMAGYGGIIVALFPNNTIYYYFSDGDSFNSRPATIAADRIRSFCTRRNGAESKPS